jgi:general nucleoside transport system permease protein
MSKVKFEHKEPLVRMVKRPTISSGKAWMIRAIALLSALAFGGLLILILGHNPFEVYAKMIEGALGKKLFIEETVKTTIPLLITAIGVAFAFKMKFWNIGSEGQLLTGAIAASAIAVYFGGTMPAILVLVIMAIASIVAGGLYGVIPAIFKSKWNTNETLFTLMLNYIALQFVRFLATQSAWQMRGTTFPKIMSFDPSTRLPEVFGVHIGWIIALVIAVLAYIYMKKTKQGYEISVVGESINTARYAGMNVSKVFIRTMFLSGALAGIAGYLIVSGADGTLTESTAGGKGFTAITVAWLSKMNPIAMIIVAFFIAILQRGSNRIQTTHGIPKSAAEVLIGIILFFMLGCEFFINYKLVFRSNEKEGV